MEQAVRFPPPKRPLGYTIKEFYDMNDFSMWLCELLFKEIREEKPEYFAYDSEIGEYLLRKEYLISFMGETVLYFRTHRL